MKVVKTIPEWQTVRTKLSGENIGFVPTMGALHKGHISLIQRSLAENEVTVVSIFVNPTQFDNPEDLQRYPKMLDKDVEILTGLSVNYLFLPDYNSLYPDEFRYKVEETELSKQLCGAYRPGHFTGVLTVVMKLLNLVKPCRAYFGEKDYQQYLLIRDMVKSFFIDVEILPCPIVREADGLAMSSRNNRLTKEERNLAPLLYRTLKSDISNEEAIERLTTAGFNVEYVVNKFGRRFAAAHLGNVRLIDNV